MYRNEFKTIKVYVHTHCVHFFPSMRGLILKFETTAWNSYYCVQALRLRANPRKWDWAHKFVINELNLQWHRTLQWTNYSYLKWRYLYLLNMRTHYYHLAYISQCQYVSYCANLPFLGDCGQPIAPRNGSLESYTSTTHGSEVFYSCDPGHLPEGRMRGVCTDNGWSPNPADLICTAGMWYD